jgi:hypothetical protein
VWIVVLYDAYNCINWSSIDGKQVSIRINADEESSKQI